jgi:methylated-DNA-[protein]-cysteine S-methyltransferase
LQLAPQGTAFQKKVWGLLTEIPYGQTITYQTLAKRMGSLGASQAVGNANGSNPIVIIQPCHRIIAANCKIGGFSAGVYRKKFLLSLEKGLVKMF